ncbi:MAG: alpha-2,8-polysialyltransferase family protein [Firmicutes bacterium]|nr:alpha-2,8-polysialyltransferase family protein [Bacillota bacterium]
MLLFKCSTLLMLITVINIRQNIYPRERADLLLGNATNYDKIIDKIKRSNIFDNVYTIEEYGKNKEFRKLKDIKKKHISKNPKQFINLPDFVNKYDLLFIGVDDEFHKLLYYALIKKGMSPKVHIYYEGATTYVLDVKERTSKDKLRHKYYGNKNFFNNVERILLYQTSLYKAPQYHFNLQSIPKLCDSGKKTLKSLNNIFDCEPLPKEKYLFFEEAFYHDRIVCNDMELFEEFAKRVGKDSVIVKLHPRTNVDRFSHRGYKVMRNSKFPFEISILNENVKDHVFVSITSSAALNSKLVLNKEINIIFLKKMFNGRTLLTSRDNSQAFFESLADYINKENKRLFVPNNLEELDEVLVYLERRRHE